MVSHKPFLDAPSQPLPHYNARVPFSLHSRCMHLTYNASRQQCMHHMCNACMQVIDPVCGRHTAVLKSSKVLLSLSNGPGEPEVMILPRHKKFEGAGKKATTKTKVSMSCHLAVDLHLWNESSRCQAKAQGQACLAPADLSMSTYESVTVCAVCMVMLSTV